MNKLSYKIITNNVQIFKQRTNIVRKLYFNTFVV